MKWFFNATPRKDQTDESASRSHEHNALTIRPTEHPSITSLIVIRNSNYYRSKYLRHSGSTNLILPHTAEPITQNHNMQRNHFHQPILLLSSNRIYFLHVNPLGSLMLQNHSEARTKPPRGHIDKLVTRTVGNCQTEPRSDVRARE